jgi:hypothetical protein
MERRNKKERRRKTISRLFHRTLLINNRHYPNSVKRRLNVLRLNEIEVANNFVVFNPIGKLILTFLNCKHTKLISDIEFVHIA